MELDLRISWKNIRAGRRGVALEAAIADCMDLALARKWRECMSIKKFAAGGDLEQSK